MPENPSPGAPPPGPQGQQNGRIEAQGPAPLPVVGLGASAGGVRALQAFFRAMAADTGTAFVVVVHLSPEHESHLADVLQAATEMPVVQVQERTRLQADHVYVIPPGKNLSLADGHLALSAFKEPRGRRAPIDVFFRTLSETHPDGIAILLSGGGSDGTVGMKAIKENGGLLLVQLPEEAEHDAMPRSAIATGLVDFVLPVRALAEKVAELRRHARPAFPETLEALPEGEAELLVKILTQLQGRTGQDFSGYKRSTMMRRIARRMRVCQVDDLAGYLACLRTDPAEAPALMKDLLISVTNFFRDADAFAALQEKVVPRLLEGRAAGDEVRLWVPGCATGEEAYSIAMLLLEAAARRDERPGIQVFATDLDEDALAYAREGLYPEAIAADVPEERLERFFVREGIFLRVKKELRERVLFAHHSLLRDAPFSKLDLVSCRNLLIYLQRELQQKVFELFHYALRPGGYLFLGTSESADGAADLFGVVDKAHRLYQWMPGAAGAPEPLPELPLSAAARARPKQALLRPGGPQQAAPDAERHRQALEAHAPPSLLVDAQHEVVHLSESVGRYLHLPGGAPTANVFKLARRELRAGLRAVLYQAFERGQTAVSAPVELAVEGERRLVQLYASLVRQEGAPPAVLVVFIEGGLHGTSSGTPSGTPSGTSSGTAAGGEADVRLRQLEEELDTTKERLQTTSEEAETQTEELKASNEELQSINEEYKSTLEELETSKEELQSVNEELKTVNDELKAKVEALTRANDDLKNLMAATDVATLFVDRELCIKRYTAPLARLFNVMPVDVGRPLGHVTHRLRYDRLLPDVRRVLQELTPVEREIEDEEGRLYLVRMLPYRTVEDRIEGVVVTAVDVTRLRNALESLRRSEERHRLLAENVKEYAIFMMSLEGRIETWNPGAERLFGYREAEAVGQGGEILFTEEDRAAGAPEAEMETAKREGQAADERWHVRKDGRRFWGSGVMTALYDGSGALRGLAKVLRDNTQREEAAEALRRSQARLRALNETLEARVAARTTELEQANEQVRRLATELLEAEQRERHALAQFLHDDLQQLLFGVKLKVGAIGQALREKDEVRPATLVSEVEAVLHHAIEQTRQITVDLSPPVLKGKGLVEAITWLVGQMADLFGLHVEVQAPSPVSPMTQERRVLLFQITRELLFNVAKHAGTDRATVGVREEAGEVHVSVVDGGAGFAAKEVLGREGVGGGYSLRRAQELLGFFGGHLEVASGQGEGTRITITVPVVAGPGEARSP